MDDELYQVHIAADPAQGIPHLVCSLARVSVILGANGSGKSRVLRAICNHDTTWFGGPRPVVFVEGGRSLQIPSALEMNFDSISRFSTYDTAIQSHRAKAHDSVSSRIVDALFVLYRQTEADKMRHSDAVEEWKNGGEPGPCPARPEPALPRLFRLFSEFFPHIQLALDKSNRITVEQAGAQYWPSQMSDGEKHTFAMLADIAMLADERSLVLVDEPELSLHPSLAASLWTSLEQAYPEAVFVYATHSIEFALRPEVQRLVMVSAGNECVEIDRSDGLPADDLRPFLGAVPALLTTSRALVVEGDTKSFDRPFYRWLVGCDCEIVSVGGCEDVRVATAQDSVWQRVAPGVRLLGVVDRDFRSDDDLARSGAGCLALDLHEAESYLCVPALVSSLAERIGTAETIPSCEEAEHWVRDWLRPRIQITAAQRALNRASITLSVSLTRRKLAEVATERELVDLLRSEAAIEHVKAGTTVSPDVVERFYHEECRKCLSAVEDGTMQEVLKLFPAKELLAHLAPRIGCMGPRQVLLAVERHLRPADFPWCAQLRQRIRIGLGMEPPAGSVEAT